MLRWWSRLSLRGRLMLLGTGGLVAGLTIASVVMVAAMTLSFHNTLDQAADRTVADTVELMADDAALPEPLPAPAGQVVQVLDPDGSVLAGNRDADLLTPLLQDDELRRALSGARVSVPGYRVVQSDTLRVTAHRVGPDQPGSGRIVVVGVPMADINHSLRLLRQALLITYPALLAVLLLVAWRVVGAALAPVDRLRAGAERITGAATAERLPVPPSRDEIHRLAVTLNDMLDRMDFARARQRAFVADAAHELRSPLASMRVQIEVAQQLDDWPAVGDDLLLDVDRLSRLVDDLLLLAHADEGDRRRGPQEPVELHTLLASVAARYAGARVPVTVDDGGGEPLWTEGEPDGLHRVLLNLVDNAVRHAGTRVVLAARADGDRVLMTVTDDGRGIPAAQRERVFDRFTRLDDARARDAGGAGLGLAIVRELVRRHGGTVRLADARPGVCAEVRLPTLAPPADTG